MFVMDFYSGPAVLMLDDEEFDVTAFIDSARGRGIEEWGGYLETGNFADVVGFRALGSDEVYIRVPGSSARDITILHSEIGGLIFCGLGSTPLPVCSSEAPGFGGFL
jgi:hypothetical protein